jgi:hypothetical protein
MVFLPYHSLVFMLDEREIHLYAVLSSLKGWRRRSCAYVGIALVPPSILDVDGARPFTLSGECVGMLLLYC